MGKTKIPYDIASGFVLQHITGGKSDAIIQWRISEDEVIQVFIPTVKSLDHVVCTKTPKL